LKGRRNDMDDRRRREDDRRLAEPRLQDERRGAPAPRKGANDWRRGEEDRRPVEERRWPEERRREPTGAAEKRHEAAWREDRAPLKSGRRDTLGGWDQRGPSAEELEAAQRLREEEERRMEEQKRAEEQFEKEAEERRQREEAEKKQKIEEARKEEQRAVMSLRRLFQRVHAAQPDNYESLKAELAEALEKEAQALGNQRQKMKEESEKVLKTSSQRIESILEERRKQEEEKKQEQAKREDLERSLAELGDLVDVAEAKTDLLKEAIEPMSRDDLGAEDIGPLMTTINEQGEEAQAAHTACQDFILSHDLMSIDQSLESLAPVRAELVRLVSRVNESASSAQQLLQDARAAKTTSVKRIAARRKVAQDDALFKRYDSDGDGHWSKEEMALFAKAELDFELSSEMLDKFFDLCVPEGDPGVSREKLKQVVSIVGIARDHARGQKLRTEREERERREAEQRAERRREVEGAQAMLEERIRSVAAGEEGLEALERQVASSEERVRPMVGKGAANMDLDELSGLVRELGSANAGFAEHLKSARERIDAMASEESLPELAEFAQLEVKKLKLRSDRLKARHSRIIAAVETGRVTSVQRSSLEIEKLRTLVTSALRKYMNDQELAIEALFASMDTDGDGFVEEAEFADMMQKTSCSDLSPDKLRRFFSHVGIDQSAGGRISREDFVQLLKAHHKVVESTVMTTGLGIKDGKVVRRLQVNEVIEVFEGPRLEDSAGVNRVRGKAVVDGSEGWITVAGNQGTRYLQEGGNLYKAAVEFELDLDQEQDVGAASASIPRTTRKLKKGEVVEVLEWARKGKEEGSSMRVRCKAKEDAVTGWTSMKDESGVVRLEML